MNSHSNLRPVCAGSGKTPTPESATDVGFAGSILTATCPDCGRSQGVNMNGRIRRHREL